MPAKKSSKSKRSVTEEPEQAEVTMTNWVEKMNQAIDDLSESRTRYDNNSCFGSKRYLDCKKKRHITNSF